MAFLLSRGWRPREFLSVEALVATDAAPMDTDNDDSGVGAFVYVV